MTVVLHGPTRIAIEGAASEDDRRRIERSIREGLRRALESSAAAGSRRVLESTTSAEVADQFDPSRVGPGPTYLLPSYADEGEFSAVKMLASWPKARRGMALVLPGPGPVPHALIGKSGHLYVNLDSPTYVSAPTLSEAVLLGTAVHATTSFAVIEGPFGASNMRYLALASEHPVAADDLGEKVIQELPPELLGKDIETFAGAWMLPSIQSTAGEFLVRGFITSDRALRWPTANLAALWLAQVSAEQAAGFEGDPEVYRVAIFNDIDELVDQIEGGDNTNLQRAAEMLSRLGQQAFSLVDWETKVKYLKVLLAAWTWEEEEKAVVEIFKSLNDDTEVDAVVDMLKRAGRYNQLFNDLDSQLYDLLVVVGQNFPRDHGPLTLDGLIRLFQSMGLLPKSAFEALTGIEVGPDGTIVVPDLLDEAQDMVMGFVRFGADLGESVLTIFTEPGKVIKGIGALVQLSVKVALASVGYLPATLELTKMLAQLSEQVLYGMRGADRLGAGEKVVNRIKWRLVWEIASLFVGVGEIKAAIQTLGLGEKFAGVLRFLGILARLGEAADVEVEGARLARLAELMKAESAVFKSVDEVSELLSHLPEDDVRKLGKALAKFDVKPGEKLADLASRSSELEGVAKDALAKAELLQAMAGKAGRLSDEIAEAFRTLAGSQGVDLAAAQRVVRAIPEGEGARFAAALKRIPVGRIAADSRAAFLELVAGSARRMDAVGKLGFETFTSITRRAAGKAEDVDRYIAALEQMEGKFAAKGDVAEYRRFLDRLERDESAAWLDVENESRLQAGKTAIGDWLQMVSGHPNAQRGLDTLLRGGYDDLAAEVLDMSDPATTLHQLEKVGELTPKQVDGLAAIKRAEIDMGGEMGINDWTDVLDLHANFRNDLLDLVSDVRGSVTDGLDVAIKRAFAGGYNVQGSLGHFYAARTMAQRFPGARFRFELPALEREIDLEMQYMGRRIDVEVKTNLGVKPTVSNSQIYKDLERHVGDQWADMLYLYAPQQSGNLAQVERGMMRNLDRLAADGKLPPGMTLPQAQTILQGRISASRPWKLVDIFDY